MLNFILESPLPLILLFGFALFVVVFVHEFGHALPVLLLTKVNITIYIGSLGERSRCFRVTLGRLRMYCKKNPLTWYKGCCVCNSYGFSRNLLILYTAAGPIASLLLTAGAWGVVMAAQDLDFWRVVAGGVFLLSLTVTLAILLPIYRVRYTPSGMPVYHDVYQIIRLIRSK